MITATSERFEVQPANVKTEPPTGSDTTEDHPVNDDVPCEVSETEDSATPNTVVHALVMPCIDFGNAVLYGVADSLKRKLQMVQALAA